MILAVETATMACSAALCGADGAVVAELVDREGPAHTQRLLTAVHEVLRQADSGWADVDVVAAGLGPGAFTGLRIGIATARSLAQADGRCRLAGVPVTSALALALAGLPQAPGRRLVPLIDGKRREVFAAVFEHDGAGGVREVTPVHVVPADALHDRLAELGSVLVGGDAARLYADRLPVTASPAAGIDLPTAAMVGRAVACDAPGLVWGFAGVLPVYGREPDARRWTGVAS